jgi:cysteine desulfurase / selenocysteine lyase
MIMPNVSNKSNSVIRSEFPMLQQEMSGASLVYLDNTATTQKPQRVIDRMTKFYNEEYATVHRGIYGLSQVATQNCDDVRSQVKSFINAASDKEIIFTKGTTESINLVAYSYAQTHLSQGQEILISEMEHHANIVPWQICAEQTGAILKVIPMNANGDLDLSVLDSLLSEKTALVAVTHVSNALGTVNDIKTIIDKAHSVGAVVLIDGAQSIAHCEVDVRALDCDFYCFSSHKMYGPTGVGVLYGKEALLNAMRPYQTGGDMIEIVTFEKTTYAELPAKFEAGTPPIAEIIGLGEAISFLQELGLNTIADIEDDLLDYATLKLLAIDGLTIIGTAKKKAAILSFVIEGVHPHDAGSILDHLGIAVRVGHHCAQPIMTFFGVPATIRASLSMYNTKADIDALVIGINKVKEVLL